MPTARVSLSTSAVNGKIYAIGGAFGFFAAVLSTVEEYDPATDKWAKKADMPTARGGFSTNVVDGKIYAIGGATADWALSSSAVEEYDVGFVPERSTEVKGKLTTQWGTVKRHIDTKTE